MTNTSEVRPATPGEPSPALRALLLRAAADRRFVGWALRRIVPATDEAALAARLDCSVGNLSRLALCLRPSGSPDRFRSEVRRIAAYAGCDPDRLRDLLREAVAIEQLRASPESGAAGVGTGLLLAARDREPDLPPDRGQPPESDGAAP